MKRASQNMVLPRYVPGPCERGPGAQVPRFRYIIGVVPIRTKSWCRFRWLCFDSVNETSKRVYEPSRVLCVL